MILLVIVTFLSGFSVDIDKMDYFVRQNIAGTLYIWYNVYMYALSSEMYALSSETLLTNEPGHEKTCL